MTKTIVIASLLLAAAGCDKDDDRRAPEGSDRDVKVNVDSAKPAADDTGINERDRKDTALTPTDQGENEGDRNITQEIRQAVMKQDGLSMNAKNVKIITRDGVVTLRGPVDGADERAQIARLAQTAAGVKRVDNQIEIAKDD